MRQEIDCFRCRLLIILSEELAYAFGDEMINSDIYLRTWRIHDTAKKLVGELDKETTDLMLAFFAQVLITESKRYIMTLPIEFKLTGMKPPIWNLAIVTGYSRMMAREMSSSWKPEIVFGAIENYFGKEKLSEIYPYYSSKHPTIAGDIGSNVYSKIMDEELTLEKYWVIIHLYLDQITGWFQEIKQSPVSHCWQMTHI